MLPKHLRRTPASWLAAVTWAACLSASPLRAAAEAKSVATPGARKDSVILFFGVYTQWYRLDAALPDCALKIANAHSERVRDFPSVKELFKAQLVILSNVHGREFSESQVKLLKAYVRKGGGLFVLGGPFTYGLGEMVEKGIAELLPVDKLEPFDLKWEKEGKTLAGAGEHVVLQGVDLGAAPRVYWVHRLTPKSDARVVMKADDYPALILGKCGKGKVAAFAGAPLGRPGPGQTPFWQWDGWLTLVRNTAAWLREREPGQ